MPRSPFYFGGSPTSCHDLLFFRRLSGIVSGSPTISVDLQHRVRILFLFGGSPTSWSNPFVFNGSLASCLDPLSVKWLSSIMPRSFFFSDALRHRVRILFLFNGSPASCSELFVFDGSPASCLNPFSFRRLFDIVFGSPIFSAAL